LVLHWLRERLNPAPLTGPAEASDQLVFEQVLFSGCRRNGEQTTVILKTGIQYLQDCNLFAQFAIFEINGAAHRVKRGAYGLERSAAASEAVRFGQSLVAAVTATGPSR
jgi:hypothetical protein